MKKIFSMLLCLLSLSITAQDNYISFSTGTDTGNLGKEYLFQFAMVYKNAEVNVGYNMHPDLDYSRYYFGAGYHFPLYAYVAGTEIKTTFIPTIEPSLIDRYSTWGGAFSAPSNSSHLTLALNLALQWQINENCDIQYALNFLPRTDLKAKYPAELWSEEITEFGVPISMTGYVKFVYKLNR